MPQLRRSRLRALTVLGLAAAAITAFVGWTLHRTLEAANAASHRVLQSHQVLRTIGSFHESFANIAAAQRGYLLMGDAAMLRERDEAIARAGEALRDLQRLTQEHAVQNDRLRQLEAVLAQRAASVRALSARITPPLRGEQLTPADVLESRRITTQAQELTQAIEREEAALLARRQATELQRQGQTSLVLIASFVCFALLLVAASGGILLASSQRRRAERQMQEVVEGLPVTVWQMRTGLDGKRRFIFVGSGAGRERGVEAEALMRDHRLALASVHEDDRLQLSDALEQSQKTLQPLDTSYRLAPRTPGEVPRWVHVQARLRRQADGAILWTGYWSDTTEQKLMEQALRGATEEAHRANRAKSTFLATMSHEIRTPMTGVLGLLELLGLTRLDGEQRATLGVIRESSRALLRIIDDILDFSKVEEGRLSLAPVPASLRDLVRRACDVHSGIASSRGLLLEQWVDPEIGYAHLFDPLRMGQVLHNFISNAVKFTEHGGVKVAVDLVERSGGNERLRLTVTDTGIGVPQERIAQLFRPFEQGTPQIASTYGGTGLGLAISRRLAELMGGTVSMRSVVGRGTRMVFEVVLPLRDPATLRSERTRSAEQRVHAVAGRRAPPTPQEAEHEGTLVLVVDDHPTNRMVLSRQLASLGYGAVVAEDGAEALAIWRTRHVGLVLTDSNMPNMNGYELAREIRRIEAAEGQRRVPILACTANAMDDEGARCAAAGMDGCLVKPLELADLLEHLQQWLPLPGGADGLPDLSHIGPEAQDSKFDAGLLAMISGGERDEERRILENYVHANAVDLATLQRAVQAYNTREVARLAHRIMGAAQTLGAEALLRACRALEENALVEEPQATLLADLRQVLARSAELEQRLYSRMGDDEVPPIAGAPTPWIR